MVKLCQGVLHWFGMLTEWALSVVVHILNENDSNELQLPQGVEAL